MYIIKDEFYEVPFVANLKHLEYKVQQYNNKLRDYTKLTESISIIARYNNAYANKFVNRFISEQNDDNNCHAIYAEVIVIAYFIKECNDHKIQSIQIVDNECDLIVTDNTGRCRYYEIMTVKPKIEISTPDNIKVNSISTHTQDKMSSIRQKILNKIRKQKQLIGNHQYSVIIELNDLLIASDFTVLSSLSDGYKVYFDKKSEIINEGYDFKSTIFDGNETSNIYSIVYFFLGDFEKRRELLNPNYK